jgi:hypothetical protein
MANSFEIPVECQDAGGGSVACREVRSHDLRTTSSRRILKRFREGLVFKARRLFFTQILGSKVSLNSRLESKNEEEKVPCLDTVQRVRCERRLL